MSRTTLPHPLHPVPQAYSSTSTSSSSAPQQPVFPLLPSQRQHSQQQQHLIHHHPIQHPHPLQQHHPQQTVAPPLAHAYHHASSSSSAPSSSSRLPHASERRLTKVLGHIAHLRKIDQESIDKRREKRHAYRHKDDDGKSENIAQACMTCRKAKTKCLNRDGEPCARCTMAGDRCTYPPQKKRGRRTDTRWAARRQGAALLLTAACKTCSTRRRTRSPPFSFQHRRKTSM